MTGPVLEVGDVFTMPCPEAQWTTWRRVRCWLTFGMWRPPVAMVEREFVVKSVTSAEEK